jgi:hypothetical protein
VARHFSGKAEHFRRRDNRYAICFGIGVLITLYAPANAATVHRSKPPEDHLRAGQHFTVHGLRCSRLDRRRDPAVAV